MCLSVQLLAPLDVYTQQTPNYVSLACFGAVSGFFLLCIYLKQPPVCVSVFVFVCVSVFGQNVYTQQIVKLFVCITLPYLCFFHMCVCLRQVLDVYTQPTAKLCVCRPCPAP